MRTGSPTSASIATLVALALAFTSTPAAAQTPAGESLPTPTPIRVESPDGPIPLAVQPDAPPPVLHADGATTTTTTTTTVTTDASGVTLRDGRVIAGTIVQVVSGQQVTIDSTSGQRHVIPWDQVAELRYASPSAPAPATISTGMGRPHLHIELTRPAHVRLYEVTGMLVTPSMNWGSYAQAQQAVPICGAPCDRVVDASQGQSFFIAGDRITPSRRFSLDGHDGPMLARVRPGRVGVLAGGIVFTSLSIAPLLSGTLYLALSSHVQASQSGHNTRNAGIALTAVGVGMLISGIVMIALGRTRVELYRRYTGAAQRRPKPIRM